MLPDCFVPTDEAATILFRVRRNLTVDQADASVLVRLGLLYETEKQFALTRDGEAAWHRYIDSIIDAL